MKVTGISVQAHDSNRVNISIDGKYRLSLDVFQLGELGIKIDTDLSTKEVEALEQESQFGKLYGRALEYSMVRPRSIKEMRDYLWRKTRATHYKTRSGEVKERSGVSQEVADRVLERLISKGYLDDQKFAKFWLENRHLRKGSSLRRLSLELTQKGIDRSVIEQLINESVRSDETELEKIIVKKRSRYPNRQKFMQYLVRQGFSYDDVASALNGEDD